MGIEHNIENMSDSAENNPPASPAPPMKKKGIKPLWIAIIAIVVVVALVAVAFYGGFISNSNEDEPTNQLDAIYQRGVLRVGTDVPYPPFEYKEPGTKDYYGVDMDIVKMIAEKMGVDIEFVPLGFTTLIGAIQAGQIDIAISAMTITADRSLSVLFSNPYYLSDQAVLVAGDSNIDTYDELNNSDVCVQLGTTGGFWVEENLSPDGYLEFDTVDLAVAAVNSGQQDAAVIDYPVARQYATNTTAYDVKVSMVIETNEQYGIAMGLGETALAIMINGILAEMVEDGSLQEILENYNAD
jgi:polar amino acid transport system substrate-binding protein